MQSGALDGLVGMKVLGTFPRPAYLEFVQQSTIEFDTMVSTTPFYCWLVWTRSFIISQNLLFVGAFKKAEGRALIRSTVGISAREIHLSA